MYPSITCLCPTYGRPKLLANALACFQHQDYPAQRRCLIVLDDLGTIEAEIQDNIRIVSQPNRVSSLPEKYNALWYMAPVSDIYVVWEDDDIQLPWCLKGHAAACENHGWSYPGAVYSDYQGHIETEPTGGRFHGCLAIRGDFLKRLGGWPLTKRADFDQNLIASLHKEGEPGSPVSTLKMPPAYIFGWHTGYEHGQSTMRGPDDETWYDRYQPPDRTGPHRIVPELNERTKAALSLDLSSQGRYEALVRQSEAMGIPL